MKISLTRLLNEIKLANKKIDKKISENIAYFDVLSNGKLKEYKSLEEMKNTVDAHLQSIKDLIKLRDKYKAALIKANNTTKLKINDVEMTIAEAIAKKDTITQELTLINGISGQLAAIKNRVERLEMENEEKLDEIIRASIGKERKTDPKEIEEISNVFRKNNKVSLADPSGVEDFITKEAEKLENFINTIDFSLSEINARTEVEV